MSNVNDLPIRTRGNPSYGVTLHYNTDRTKVSARSHFPYLWVNSDQLHVDKTQYRDASPPNPLILARPISTSRSGSYTE